MSDREPDDGGMWDPESAYKRVRDCVLALQPTANPSDCILLVREQRVRLSLCGNGELPVDLYEQALDQLETHDELAVGDRYLSYPNNARLAREAIEYVVDEDDPDTQFVGSMNRLLDSGELEPDPSV